MRKAYSDANKRMKAKIAGYYLRLEEMRQEKASLRGQLKQLEGQEKAIRTEIASIQERLDSAIENALEEIVGVQ